MKTTGIVFNSEMSRGVEPDATVLYDRSRWRNNGAFVGDGNPDWVQLPSGLWVLDFDGENDIITIPYVSSMQLSTQGTVELWVNTSSANQTLLGTYKTAPAELGWYISTKPTGELAFAAIGLMDAEVTSTNILPLSRFVYMVVTFNGTNTIFYIDGVLDRSVGQTGSITAYTYDLLMMSYSTFFYASVVGKLRIRNYVLSAGKIKQIFEAERHFFGV